MITIIVPLKHIILDPTNPVDLSTLPEQDAIDLIKQSYGFLSTAIDVSIKDGVATIALEQQRADKINDVLKFYPKGVREAQQGSYAKAIKYFSKVIEVIPEHVEARRNLAMAHLESGDVSQARELLRQCLKIDPTNVWTYVLLGNIATRHERAFDVAEFYYEAGLNINPKDNLLLNNFATLHMEQGHLDRARELFNQALAIDPAYPNTYYGLALVNRLNGNPEAALKILKQLFEQPVSTDIRSVPVYKNARELYLELSTEIARRNSRVLMESILERKSALESATGHPIVIEEDNSLEYISAVSQMAWKHKRNEHRVRYRMRSEAMTPHLVAHELEHIVLEQEARLINRNRFFATTAKTREYAVHAIADHITKLQRQGYSEDRISDIMLKLIQGLTGQLFNLPLDMLVERNIYNKYPNLRHSQFASLHQMHTEGLLASK
ncbi:MAG: tetratricopeptide repeat protein [Smithellaceae bacterium]|nr:tetratricopeptide repeat protein [Smithellaceae bacterium]